MNLERTEKIMKMFSDKVIRDARYNLKGKGSGKLANSLDYDLKVYPSGALELNFKSESYAKFVDKGVKGSESSAKAPQSPYKYTTKMPPTKALDKWVVRKGLKGTRDEKGKFVKRKSIVFGVAKSIQLYGLPATKFFSKAFNKNYQKLPADFTKAYANDVMKFIKATAEQIAK